MQKPHIDAKRVLRRKRNEKHVMEPVSLNYTPKKYYINKQS